MKQAKVRLIRQMKEESEKVRTWKIQKEKEVNQLKQVERKQQVKMAKMANLHSKQQNVLKIKMDEAIAANKRLKDVLDKQKAAKKMSAMAGNEILQCHFKSYLFPLADFAIEFCLKVLKWH